jgi:hypothetical protein
VRRGASGHYGDVAASTTAIVGFRRSRRSFLGSQVRVLTVRDGLLRVVAPDGEEQERVALSEAQVGLKRGMVEVSAPGRRFFLYGLPGINKIPAAVVERARAEPSETGLGPAEGTLDAFAVSRAVYELLESHGARPSS